VELFRAVEGGAADARRRTDREYPRRVGPREYDLLSAHALHVVAETELRIRHCLIASPRTRLPDVRRVASHPVALAQCRRFFTTHPDIVAVPAYDTAGSVRDLMTGNVDAEAAIASKLAAELYGARVLEEGLEDHAENYTRFLVIARDPASREAANKTSLILSLGKHSRHAASRVGRVRRPRLET